MLLNPNMVLQSAIVVLLIVPGDRIVENHPTPFHPYVQLFNGANMLDPKIKRMTHIRPNMSRHTCVVADA